MNISVRLLAQHEWKQLHDDAFKAVFGEHRPGELDRADFTLLVLDDNGDASGYVSCIEMDSETVYWQHGGATPQYQKTIYAIQGYRKLIEWCRTDYRRITTRIENTNLAMLKMALHIGFIIQGTYNHKGQVFLELCLELEQGG